MPHPIEPTPTSSPPPYAVPWLVARTDRTHSVITNAGLEPVDFVKVMRSDASSVDLVDLWGQVLPTEAIELCLCGSRLEGVVVTIAWFRQHDGLEYVWRFAV